MESANYASTPVDGAPNLTKLRVQFPWLDFTAETTLTGDTPVYTASAFKNGVELVVKASSNNSTEDAAASLLEALKNRILQRNDLAFNVVGNVLQLTEESGRVATILHSSTDKVATVTLVIK